MSLIKQVQEELIKLDESKMSEPITMGSAVKNIAVGAAILILLLEIVKKFTGNKADTKLDAVINSLRFIASSAATAGTIIK